MKNINILSLALFFSLFTFSCRDDFMNEERGDITPIGNEPNTIVESNLTGVVTKHDKSPLSWANVYVAGEMTTADESGVYRFENIDLSHNGTLVKIEKEGFFDGFQFISGMPGENTYLETALVEKKAYEFSNDEGGIVAINGESSVTFEPNSLVTRDGSIYQGTVIMHAHWYDPSSPELGTMMPGDLRGLNQDKEPVQLISYGMMAVELSSTSGQELHLADGQTAKLTFQIPDNSEASDYTSIPMWHLDESTGVWLEEGAASVEGDVIIAEVGHFSFWNCDAPFDIVNLKGTLVNSEGLALANQKVSIKDNSTNEIRSAYTNQNGHFMGKVPMGVELSLFAEECGENEILQNLGILRSDTDLGEISVNDMAITRITATLLDCDAMVITKGYLLIETPEGLKVVSPDSNGKISYSIFGCSGSVATITAYDLGNSKIRSPQEVELGKGDLDLMAISICDDFDQQILYTVNSGVDYVMFDDAEVVIADNRILYLWGIDEDYNYLMLKYDLLTKRAEFRATAHVGTSTVNTGGFDLPLDLGPISSVGDEISAAFKEDGGFEVNFKLEIDRLVSSGSISGMAWHDLNGNGIRESDEPPLPNKFIEINYNIVEQSTPDYNRNYRGIFDRIQTGHDGHYSFEGLIIDRTYYLSYDKRPSEEVSPYNIGNDFVSSDFELGPNPDEYVATHITISDGEDIQNIDLGLQVSPLTCQLDYLCCPTTGFLLTTPDENLPIHVLATNFIGEIVYDEMHSTNQVEMPLPTGTRYSFTVEDQLGNIWDENEFLPEKPYRISGYVWVDADSGTVNKKDQNDLPYRGITIELIDENGEVVRDGHAGSNGFFQFLNLEPGRYRIQTDLPFGYEYVEQGSPLEIEDSHIDPTTGISLEREVMGLNWDTLNTLNVGLKEL